MEGSSRDCVAENPSFTMAEQFVSPNGNYFIFLLDTKDVLVGVRSKTKLLLFFFTDTKDISEDTQPESEVDVNNKLYKCKACSYTSANKTDLKKHKRSHTAEKPFECKMCNCRFRKNYHLKRHLRGHSGEVPFECTTCSAKFTMKGDLYRHLLIHRGKKRFQCGLCHRRYTQKRELQLHMKDHN